MHNNENSNNNTLINISVNEDTAEKNVITYRKLTETVFDILEKTKNFSEAFSNIMSNIGELFCINYASIRWLDENNNDFILVNQWKSSPELHNEKQAYHYSERLLRKYMLTLFKNSLLIKQDIDLLTIDSHLKIWAEDINASSLFQLPIYEGQIIIGVLTFASIKKDCHWTDAEQKTLQLISRVISAHAIGNRTKLQIDERARELTSYDPLTGLLTLPEFKRRGAIALEENDGKQQLMITSSDFTNFKHVNDALGKQEGDKILIAFADFIRSFEVGVIATRDYADCIMSLSFATTKKAAYQVIQDANKAFCMEQNKLHPEITLNISSGIYLFGPDERDISTGIDNAYLARKLVKKEKTHGVRIFEPYMLEDIKYQAKIASDFKTAIRQHEFLLYLQPQINIDTMEIIGAEALVRWRKPDGQFVYPNQFIPVLEKSGDIIELDFYMLERVLEFLVKWRDLGAELFPISVNFSRLHLFIPEFSRDVYDKIKTYDIDSRYIDIEVTESVFVKDYVDVARNINELRNKGISIAIDDFGTGYSSLNILTQIVADTIKIDKSFLDNAEKDYATRCVIEYTVMLAEKLNMRIICEGVETENQISLLKDINCKYIQGYYFERPIDLNTFEQKYMDS